jgi:hypothetical protein
LVDSVFWHTDSTFLPTPALVNILTARTLPASGGGETELASTRVGWASMPAELRARLQDAIIWHRLSHSRARISPDLARLPAMNKWPDRPWRAIWPNPVTGQGSLYIASHSFAIEGMGLEEGQAIIDAAIAPHPRASIPTAGKSAMSSFGTNAPACIVVARGITMNRAACNPSVARPPTPTAPPQCASSEPAAPHSPISPLAGCTGAPAPVSNSKGKPQGDSDVQGTGRHG